MRDTSAALNRDLCKTVFCHRLFVKLFFGGLVQCKQAGRTSTDGLKVATNIHEKYHILHERSDTKSIIHGGGGGVSEDV